MFEKESVSAGRVSGAAVSSPRHRAPGLGGWCRARTGAVVRRRGCALPGRKEKWRTCQAHDEVFSVSAGGSVFEEPTGEKK